VLPVPQLDDVEVYCASSSDADPDLIAHPPAFVQLGRFGDLLLLLPAWKAWADLVGAPIHVVSTQEFGTVLEGASYVAPTLLNINWQTGIRTAMEKASELSPHVVVTQLHGANWRPPQPDSLASYSLTMWKRTGFLRYYAELPLVMDQRHPGRETLLARRWVRTKRPLILVNLDGWTSPIGRDRKQALGALLDALPGVEVLHLDRARAVRVYDQLALMDIAAGLLTCDTMPLHLVSASAVPYVALVRDDGQSGSIPKGNCVLRVGYSEIAQRLPEIERALHSFLHV
jgi:hypothetical protein